MALNLCSRTFKILQYFGLRKAWLHFIKKFVKSHQKCLQFHDPVWTRQRSSSKPCILYKLTLFGWLWLPSQKIRRDPCHSEPWCQQKHLSCMLRSCFPIVVLFTFFVEEKLQFKTEIAYTLFHLYRPPADLFWFLIYSGKILQTSLCWYSEQEI